jgi:hypothetical protein
MATTRRRAGSASTSLSDREWRIVEAMYRLMPEGPRTVTYEDIVVKAWELDPDQFGLRGYSDKYPDASDVHKPLYNTLKSRGWVQTGARGQKKFTLTPSGWERAQSIFSSRETRGDASGRAARATEEELRHLERTAAAALYLEGKQNEILDTDFFAFYRTSVRAGAQEFEGRLSQVRSALEDAARKQMPGASEFLQIDQFLRKKFAELISAKSERKKRGA